MPQTATYVDCCHIRDALKESDRLDALVEAYRGSSENTMTIEEFEHLEIQQHGAWALVRVLVLDAADTSSYDPPVCVDIGDAVIIVYGYQDFGDGARSMDAGWIASWRVTRPEPVPAWAVKSETDDDEEAA